MTSGVKRAGKSLLRLFSSTTQPTRDGWEEFWALRDIYFDIREGDRVGIIGRNGAGKSTLLKILSRITDPSTGRITIRGRIASLLEVGTGFHPELSGRENIFLNGAILGMSRAEIRRKFDEVVAFAEVEQFLDTPVKRYSSGMYVRLAFAVAAHLDPEILVVDEVLAVGDAQFQRKCLGKMEDVGKSGRTILFVSHDMNAIERLCTRALLLEHGRISAYSHDVREVVSRYLVAAGGGTHPGTWINTKSEFANPWFTPEAFSVTDAQGQPLAMPCSNDSEMWVHIEGTVDLEDSALQVGYALYSEDGMLLYWTFHTDGKERDWPKLAKGRHAVRSKVPSRFLNEGTYRIELMLALYFRQWLAQPGVSSPSIFLEVRGGLSDSPYWMMKRPGALAPQLEWKK